MDAMSVLDRAQELGLHITLSPEGEVKIKGSKTPAALALVAELRNHKAAIIEALTATATTATIGDLTDYIGQDVDGATWAALQAECQRRYGGLWTMYADLVGDNYHVTRLHARPE